jgi:hypothetical protein
MSQLLTGSMRGESTSLQSLSVDSANKKELCLSEVKTELTCSQQTDLNHRSAPAN